ncbi:MAG: DUF378 domain-containing protein [Clostridiales bacterium]|nr:DUF378 domain-containing protein [Clostridiales bacterium]
MLSFISFLLVCVGCINWFCIGILQFDFVAGIFGSQSNVFSRLVYTLVGVASIVVVVNFIMNKGKFVVSFKKDDKELSKAEENKRIHSHNAALASTESAEDFSLANKLKSEKNHNLYTTESAEEMGNNDQNGCHCNKSGSSKSCKNKNKDD